jgi:hypothetical protein
MITKLDLMSDNTVFDRLLLLDESQIRKGIVDIKNEIIRVQRESAYVAEINEKSSPDYYMGAAVQAVLYRILNWDIVTKP